MKQSKFYTDASHLAYIGKEIEGYYPVFYDVLAPFT